MLAFTGVPERCELATPEHHPKGDQIHRGLGECLGADTDDGLLSPTTQLPRFSRLNVCVGRGVSIAYLVFKFVMAKIMWAWLL